MEEGGWVGKCLTFADDIRTATSVLSQDTLASSRRSSLESSSLGRRRSLLPDSRECDGKAGKTKLLVKIKPCIYDDLTQLLNNAAVDPNDAPEDEQPHAWHTSSAHLVLTAPAGSRL